MLRTATSSRRASLPRRATLLKTATWPQGVAWPGRKSGYHARDNSSSRWLWRPPEAPTLMKGTDIHIARAIPPK